jgi:uncharacterized protein YraI
MRSKIFFVAALVSVVTTQAFAQYRVVNIASNDVLSVRSGASTEYPIVGVIPPDGIGIDVHDCLRVWCNVSWRGVTGWVNSRFLRPEGANLPPWLRR